LQPENKSLGNQPINSSSQRITLPTTILSMKKRIVDVSELLIDWNWKKNNLLGLSPSNLSIGSNKTAWWKCHICGYEWTTRIERKARGSKCKHCSAKHLSIPVPEKSLAYLYPNIAKEWDYGKNEMTPDQVYPLSNKNYWWLCSEGHSWETTASHRISRKNSCPICSGQVVLEGYNDFKTTHPELMAEWDWEANNAIELYPNKISYGADKIANWKCSRGHRWKAVIYSRTGGDKVGCPHCNKENRTSFPEKAIAFYISKFFPDIIENYRVPEFGKNELDIFIPCLRIGIEYDGSHWHKKTEKDIAKDKLCTAKKIMLIRVREPLCPQYSSDSIKVILADNNDSELAKAILDVFRIINERHGLNHIPDVDLKRDNAEIQSSTLSRIKAMSIANSPLINEWDNINNHGIDPSMVSLFSNRKFWWVCPTCGNNWYASASHRASGENCPVCAGQKVVKGYNDLETLFPQIAKEWDTTRNNIFPYEVSGKSNKKYWWVCSKCGHHWKTQVYVRTGMNCGCPECKKISISKKNGRKVINLDNGIIYHSLKKAAEELSINAGGISNCCRGLSKTAGGYHWKYYDE